MMAKDQAAAPCPVVLHLITGLGVGGAERVVIGLAGKLHASGCKTVVAALDGNRQILDQYQDCGFPVHSLNTSSSNPWSVLCAIWRLAGIVRREQIRVVHAHMFHALLAGLVCRLLFPRLKLVFTSHSIVTFSWQRRLIIRLSRRFRAADVLFLEGQHAELNAAVCHIIPNGVPVGTQAGCAAPRPGRPRPVFLFVGRLEPAKDPLALIDAFADMRHTACELWICGNGMLRGAVEQRIVQAGLGARVKLLGVRNDVASLLGQADCFVMSSSWEGMPMALLEAGAACLPVVATPVGAIARVLADECGYLAHKQDLARAMDEVLDHPDEARRRGSRLRQRVADHYSIEHMIAAHAAMYSQLDRA